MLPNDSDVMNPQRKITIIQLMDYVNSVGNSKAYDTKGGIDCVIAYRSSLQIFPEKDGHVTGLVHGSINLSPWAEKYASGQDPKELTDLIDSIMTETNAMKEEDVIAKIKAMNASDRLEKTQPFLRHKSFLNVTTVKNPLWRTFSDGTDLVVLYMVQVTKNLRAMVTKDMLPLFGMTEDELHEKACDNLQSGHYRMTMTNNKDSLYIDKYAKAYDMNHVLCGGLLEDAAAYMGTEKMILLPMGAACWQFYPVSDELLEDEQKLNKFVDGYKTFIERDKTSIANGVYLYDDATGLVSTIRKSSDDMYPGFKKNPEKNHKKKEGNP